MNYPFISAKCVTYGRIETLVESVYSFLTQKYPGKKELVIVNDYPKQTIIFDHPEVKVFNLNKTFKTIGEKDNFAVSKCSADIIAVWDDDDVALPNHLTNIAKFFKADTDLLHWQRGIFSNYGRITDITSLGNSGIVFSKKIWETLGGYPQENAGHDMSFVLSIKSNSRNIVLASPPDNEVSWYYIWGGRSYHMSGQGTDTENRPNIIQRHSEYIESQRIAGYIPTGEIHLQPKWNIDYEKLLKDFLEARKKPKIKVEEPLLTNKTTPNIFNIDKKKLFMTNLKNNRRR